MSTIHSSFHFLRASPVAIFLSAGSFLHALDYTSFSLADSGGGLGDNGNNVSFFDGIDGTPGPSFPEEPFETLLYLRERIDSLAVRKVQANVLFDVSGLNGPVSKATLDFSAYAVNATDDLTVTISRLDAEMAYDAASSLPRTIEANFFGRLTAGEFSVDVTEIVNSWIAGEPNLGFLLKIDQAVNDGFGIADDSDDGTAISLTLPGDGDPPRITSFIMSESDDPPNRSASFVFTSEADKSYSLYYSSDLESPVDSWIEINDNIPGQAEFTTIDLDFVASDIPVDQPKLFFIIRDTP